VLVVEHRDQRRSSALAVLRPLQLKVVRQREALGRNDTAAIPMSALFSRAFP